MSTPSRKNILEAAIMAAESPLNLDRMKALFLDEPENPAPTREELRTLLDGLADDYAGHGIELHEVAGGWRFQTREECAPWVNRLWEERKPRYSRALFETLVIIAYRQPITRAEIEDIRGVAVSSSIIKTLHEREWVKVVGHRDVPGRPAIYATTREFLDYFNLTSLSQLPTLAELRDVDELSPDLFADFEAQAVAAEKALPRGDEEDEEGEGGEPARGAGERPAAPMAAVEGAALPPDQNEVRAAWEPGEDDGESTLVGTVAGGSAPAAQAIEPAPTAIEHTPPAPTADAPGEAR